MYTPSRTHPSPTLLAFLILCFLLCRYLSPLHRYTGPFLASGTRLHSLYTTYRGRTHEDHITLQREYGLKSASNPTNSPSPHPKPPAKSSQPAMASTRAPFYWAFHSPATQKSSPRSEMTSTPLKSVSSINPSALLLTKHSLPESTASSPSSVRNSTHSPHHPPLERNYTNYTIVNLGSYLHYLAFDMMGEVAFASSFGFLKQCRDIDHTIAVIEGIQTYDGIIGQIPWLDFILRVVPYWVELPFITPMAQIHVTETVLRQLKARKDGTAVVEWRGLLSQLFEANEEHPEKFSDESIFAAAHGAILAGNDGTASIMQRFMWNMLAHGNIYQPACGGNLARRRGWFIRYHGMGRTPTPLPYFQVCLKDAMRAGPAD